VVPPASILTEPTVAWVDKVVRRHGTEQLAKAYLEQPFTKEGQEIIAGTGIAPRPRQRLSPEKYATLPQTGTVYAQGRGRRLAEGQKTHFNEGGVFDQIQHSTVKQ